MGPQQRDHAPQDIFLRLNICLRNSFLPAFLNSTIILIIDYTAYCQSVSNFYGLSRWLQSGPTRGILPRRRRAARSQWKGLNPFPALIIALVWRSSPGYIASKSGAMFSSMHPLRAVWGRRGHLRFRAWLPRRLKKTWQGCRWQISSLPRFLLAMISLLSSYV